MKTIAVEFLNKILTSISGVMHINRRISYEQLLSMPGLPTCASMCVEKWKLYWWNILLVLWYEKEIRNCVFVNMKYVLMINSRSIRVSSAKAVFQFELDRLLTKPIFSGLLWYLYLYFIHLFWCIDIFMQLTRELPRVLYAKWKKNFIGL